jgi:hypothetical protein
VARGWSGSTPTIERITATWSITRATFGQPSAMRTPETLVSITFVGPMHS